MITNIVFLVLVALVGCGVTFSVLRVDQLTTINPGWRRLRAKHESGEALLCALIKVALFIAGLALYGLLIWLFDVRYSRQVLAGSAYAFVGGMWGTYYFKKNDYLKW